MSKHSSTTRRVSVKKEVSSRAAKQNVDTIYLIQNQNQILKLKNAQMEEKIATMKVDLIQSTSGLAKDEQQCERLRLQIKKSQITQDMRLETEKRAMQQKIQLIRGNCQIVARKIGQARQAAVFQENKIPSLKQQKKILEKSLWEHKTENEGTKIILQNLQKQLERYRAQNAEMTTKRKVYGPKQSQISKTIEEKLRIIQSRQKISKQISKDQSIDLLFLIIRQLQLSRKRSSLVLIQQIGFNKKIIKKHIFLLGIIKKKYLLFVKNKVMQRFRQSFQPLEEQNKYQNIIENTRKRRIKNRMFLIWRSQSNKREYIKTRYFEVQTTLQKISDSFLKSVLFSTFNTIKYLGLNSVHRRAALKIQYIVRFAELRCKSLFISSLNSLGHNYLRDLEVEQSAKQQSILLVTSVYFTAWAKVTKDNKVSNRFIKFKYFRELKKLLALKKKQHLSQMLMLTHQKIVQIDKNSVAFCHIKKQTQNGLIETLTQQLDHWSQKNEQQRSRTSQSRLNNKQQMNTFCLLKLSGYLKKQMGKAFNFWRNHNFRLRKLNTVMDMVNRKLNDGINLGFVMIQKRKFQKLKLSIADKIQSCQFSYNYLVQQNTHIKEVLENKLLELEKSKFSNILRKLIRAQKQAKHKYFFKFLKNGYKCWQFKKTSEKVDRLIEQKIKRVFMFLVKLINKQKTQQISLQNKVEAKVQKLEYRSNRLIFGVLENIARRNKKVKKILQNIFSRNLQLGVYNGYNRIKKILTNNVEGQVQSRNQNVENKIKDANNYTSKLEQNIQILRGRLSSKQSSIKSRILLACRKIFVRNSSKKYLNYFDRWRNKLVYEKRVQKFVQILERKTRISLKNRLVNCLIKKNGDEEVGQLKKRLENFSNQFSQASGIYDKFVQQSQQQMKTMDEENTHHQAEGKMLQKKTDRMDDIKISSFRVYWGKMMCKFVFRQWKIHKAEFIDQWMRTFDMLEFIAKRETFLLLSGEMRNQIIRNRTRKNLSYIYAKKFRHNAGLAFKIWRIANLNAKIKASKAAYDVEIANHKLVTGKYEKITEAYDKSVNSRIGDLKMRKIFDFLKKYTRLKIDNNKNKLKLETWLKRGYQLQFSRLFFKKFKFSIQKNRKADQFSEIIPHKKMKDLFYKLSELASRKKYFNKLFLGKFVQYSLVKLYEQFFTKTKNYYRYIQITKKNHKTMCIQKVIECFDKKRKDILCANIRKWRKNQYEMGIGQKLFKRITRKAIYNRYQGMFYAWKLESEAKKVLKYHYQQGEVKKRKVEIMRIQKFLHEFKKQKGLLLENDQGNFVMSPRFQKKKQEQELKDKNLRYKFISRLIMSINGFEQPIKAYNNISIYMKLREKYRNSALFVLNHLRRPDTLLAFRTWRKAATQFKENFQNMERKELIKILNRQKDKMEMEYSNKLSMDEKIQGELHRYKIYSHQRDKKEKLCAYVFMRNAKKVKQFAFSTWRKNSNQLRDQENIELAQRGESKLEYLEQQIKQMKEVQQQLSFNNTKLKQAITQALQIAELVKSISQQRDKLSRLILEKNLTCESLIEENQTLNSKLYLAQKEAIHLLVLSGEQP